MKMVEFSMLKGWKCNNWKSKYRRVSLGCWHLFPKEEIFLMLSVPIQTEKKQRFSDCNWIIDEMERCEEGEQDDEEEFSR